MGMEHLPKSVQDIIAQLAYAEYRTKMLTLGRVADRRYHQVAYEGEDKRKGPRRSAEIRKLQQGDSNEA